MKLTAIILNVPPDETGTHIVVFGSHSIFSFQNSPGIKFFSNSGTSLDTLLGDIFF
jgi:hypothetical protein